MHEMSLALEICRIAEAHALPLPASAVTEVGIEVGDAAGVDAENLKFCLEATLATEPFRHARPRVSRRDGDALRVTYVEVDDGS